MQRKCILHEEQATASRSASASARTQSLAFPSAAQPLAVPCPIHAADWAAVLKPSGAKSLRATDSDAFVIGLVLAAQDAPKVVEGGFDGAYTYFASRTASAMARPETWVRPALKTPLPDSFPLPFSACACASIRTCTFSLSASLFCFCAPE